MYSMLMSKARAIKSQSFVGSWNSCESKKLRIVVMDLVFKKNRKNISFDCYNTLAIGIAIIKFHVNVNSDLKFTIILYPFLFHNIFESEYCNLKL